MPQAYAPPANSNLANVQQDNTIDENMVNVFPMPARDIMNVELPDAFVDTVTRISIHSMYGTVLQSTGLSGVQSTQLNVSQLAAGTYVLRIVSGTQRIDKAISIIKMEGFF